MTLDQITQLRQLLKKARQEVRNLTPAGICYPLYEELSVEKVIDEALALLPCLTCNGSEIKKPESGCGECLAGDGNCRAECPCPDCK